MLNIDLENITTQAQEQLSLLKINNNKNAQFALLEKDNKFYLFDKVLQQEITIDFLSEKLQYRLKTTYKNSDFMKATGLNNHKNLSILDTTAGLGTDSFIFSQFSKQVIACEKNVLLYFLLTQAKNNTKIDNLSFINMNAIDFMSSTKEQFNVIYLDPMFPTKQKSAKVKKEMQILHNFIGESLETNDKLLFEKAFDLALNRIVVKRAKQSEYIDNKKPSISFVGKANRFDVYTKKAFEK